MGFQRILEFTPAFSDESHCGKQKGAEHAIAMVGVSSLAPGDANSAGTADAGSSAIFFRSDRGSSDGQLGHDV
jgi:hypothetical protein